MHCSVKSRNSPRQQDKDIEIENTVKPCLDNINFLYFQLLASTCGYAMEYCTKITKQNVYILNFANVKGKL